eukprot:comp22018_c0_seq1/m.50654 comp22018_c0_seq1/g.50654  ORF comp22018_c0_seq1/g.50654 comp22018_c0_seq1/m.50654 type:complete len:767 (-) comp22018_c0_seq1:119-2419(-)
MLLRFALFSSVLVALASSAIVINVAPVGQALDTPYSCPDTLNGDVYVRYGQRQPASNFLPKDAQCLISPVPLENGEAAGLNEVGNCYLKCLAAHVDATVRTNAMNAVNAAVTKVSGLLSGIKGGAAGQGVTVTNSSSACQFDITGDLNAPPSFAAPSGTVAGADFVLFVTTRPTMGLAQRDNVTVQIPQNMMSYGRVCQVDSTSGRPLTGHINIDLAKFAVNPTAAQNMITSSLINALGFNRKIFESKAGLITTSTTSQYSQYNNYMSNNTYTKTQYFFTGPLATAEARAHFDCPTLPGVELEDGFPTPSNFFDTYYVNRGVYAARSFLEKRVFGPEAMTSGLRQDGRFVISRISLAVLDDLGFYTINYAGADTLTYGYKMGCAFATQSCSMLTCNFDRQFVRAQRAAACRDTSEYSYYFCKNDPAQPLTCSYDALSIARCPTTLDWGTLPASWRYFSDTKAGGKSAEADMCPVAEFTTADLCATSNNIDVLRGESNGPNSACMMSSFLDKAGNGVAQDPRPACIKYKCLSPTSLAFTLSASSRKDIWYVCDDANKNNPSISDSSLPAVQGTVICPKASILCANTPVDTSLTIILGVQPATGADTGGTKVTITGTNFPAVGPNLVVIVGGNPVQGACEENAGHTQLVCTTAAAAANATLGVFSYVRVYDKTNPSTGGYLGESFGYKTAPPPSPEPSQIFVPPPEKNFFKKQCIGIPCFIIPIIFICLTLPCLVYMIIHRSKKGKKTPLQDKTILDEDGEADVNNTL